MRARKRLGQHFLTDASVISGIADQVSPSADDAMLEIGPGRGALTEALYGRSRIFKAIELDRDAYQQMDELEATHWWFVARREIIQTVLTRLIELPASSKILEAGCGTGGNLDLLAEMG